MSSHPLRTPVKPLRYLVKQSVRDATVAGVLAVVFLTTGSCAPPGVASMIGGAPFDLDISLRALAQGWYTTDRTVPVTIVDIDEATQAKWGRPPVTPRADLARLIATVAAAHPRAVVVDIDLSWSNLSAQVDAGRVSFRRFLERYQQPAPLVFPKRVVRDSGQRDVLVVSDLDDLIGVHPNLIWANANFSTGNGGAVRDWDEWLDVCVGNVARKLPSVPMVAIGKDTVSSPTGGAATPMSCDSTATPTSHRLLLGPRMTGPTRIPTAKVQTISATMLLAPNVARNDVALFADRVVLIGATHQDAGDVWLTPRGIIPGVELLASIIHFSPLTLDDAVVSTRQWRTTTVIVFLLLALGTWWLTGIATVAGVILGMLILTGVAVGVFEWFWFFDAVAAALTLMLAYEATRAVIELGMRVRAEMRPPPHTTPAADTPRAAESHGGESTKRGFLKALGRSCIRKELLTGGAQR